MVAGELFPLFGTFERVFEGSSLSLFGVRVRVRANKALEQSLLSLTFTAAYLHFFSSSSAGCAAN